MSTIESYWEKLNQLFSVILVIDADMRITCCSESCQRWLSKACESQKLCDVFDIKRPLSINSFDDLCANTESLALLVAHDQSFAVRGQVVEVSTNNGRGIGILGGPWLHWMQSNRPDISLGLSDFAPQDAQLDHLFHISTEKVMVEDLEELNRELKTTTKQLEAAQEVKNAFFATVSHEMRTPLNGIASAITLMEDNSLNEQSTQLLRLARQSTNNLMQVVNYVLDVSKMETIDRDSEEISFNLNELVSSILDTVRAKAIEQNIRLDLVIEPDLPLCFKGYVAALKQALLNLLINAIKFTDAGTVTLHIKTAQTQGMSLRFEVIDTGIGIAEEDYAAIFEPFKRAVSKEGNQSNSGTGLGLDIVRRNVASLGGNIALTSAPGQGSSFVIEVPFLTTDDSALSPETISDSSLVQFDSSNLVLLVDDNETNLMLGAMILESMGIKVITSKSGEEAVKQADDNNIDLILMDINMPDIDGCEAAKRIRTSRNSDKLPIIALTAYTDEENKRKSEECGMNGFLTKPIRRDQLEKTLAVFLSNSRLFKPAKRQALATTKRLDLDLLNQLLVELGAEHYETVIAKFFTEVDIRWLAIKEAACNEDLSKEAHTLASTCRSFGLYSAADQLAEIEHQANTAVFFKELPEIEKMEHELMAGMSELRALADATI